MGIVRVARWATSALPAGAVTRTPTFSRTSSAACAESRSTCPSAYRCSMTMFPPSAYPRSRSASRTAANQCRYGSVLEASERSGPSTSPRAGPRRVYRSGAGVATPHRTPSSASWKWGPGLIARPLPIAHPASCRSRLIVRLSGRSSCPWIGFPDTLDLLQPLSALRIRRHAPRPPVVLANRLRLTHCSARGGRRSISGTPAKKGARHGGRQRDVHRCGTNRYSWAPTAVISTDSS